MKKILAIVLAVGLLAATLPAGAIAGDRGWATTGKVLTGIIGLSILGNAIANTAPVYGPPPGYYHRHYPEQVWVPGHYEVQLQRRWESGRWEIADGYDYDHDGYYDRREARRVWVPGGYRDVEVRLWVPGHWETRG
jgi:hypothetical protein